MNVTSVKYRGFRAIALLRHDTIVAYWSDYRSSWVPEAEVADIALWTQEQLARNYLNDYRARLYSVPWTRRDRQMQSADA